MADTPSEIPETAEELYRTDSFTAFRVLRDRQTYRLTRISRELSDSIAFRAAFRKDQSVLSNLRHHNILQFLEWGESAGQLFYVTEFPEGSSLQSRIQTEASFSIDEVIDIGWQIASAIQHAHNLGVTHGHLTTDSIQIADPVRIKVAGFGLYRWIAAADQKQPDSNETWNEPARRDLKALGEILSSLVPTLAHAQDSTNAVPLLEELQALITSLTTPNADLIARDVQGQLGEMLLHVAGDSIEMVDHRKGQGLSRRSIVDELFDESTTKPEGTSADTQPSSTGCAIIFLAAVSLIILTGAISVKHILL